MGFCTPLSRIRYVPRASVHPVHHPHLSTNIIWIGNIYRGRWVAARVANEQRFEIICFSQATEVISYAYALPTGRNGDKDIFIPQPIPIGSFSFG